LIFTLTNDIAVVFFYDILIGLVVSVAMPLSCHLLAVDKKNETVEM
jgi:hypothetical protein